MTTNVNSNDYKYEEDLYYVGHTEGTPQAARASWGKPEAWMTWLGHGYPPDGGEYSGIQSQDRKKRFILYGGGFDDYAKYIGSYSLICPDDIPILDDKFVLLDGEKPARLSLLTMPNNIDIVDRSTGNIIMKCEAYPTDHFHLTKYSPEALKKKDVTTQFINLRNMDALARKTNSSYITEMFDVGNRLLAKIINVDQNIVTVEMSSYVGSYTRIGPIENEPKRHIVLRFKIPDFLKAYASEITTSQLSMTTFSVFLNGEGFLILKNGLYLQRLP